MKSVSERTNSTSAKILPTILEGSEKPAIHNPGPTVAPAPSPSSALAAEIRATGTAQMPQDYACPDQGDQPAENQQRQVTPGDQQAKKHRDHQQPSNIRPKGQPRGLRRQAPDLEEVRLGEFQEVGDYVRHLASEDAVVKIGTVVDPALGGELRVTVVVTGLNAIRQKGPVAVEISKEQEPRVVNGPRQPVNYSDLDPPTIRRKKPLAIPPTLYEEEALSDIPAFLRRQAD